MDALETSSKGKGHRRRNMYAAICQEDVHPIGIHPRKVAYAAIRVNEMPAVRTPLVVSGDHSWA